MTDHETAGRRPRLLDLKGGTVQVDRAHGKWRAQITVNRVNHYLGLFDTIEEATAARKQAERDLWGEEAP